VEQHHREHHHAAAVSWTAHEQKRWRQEDKQLRKWGQRPHNCKFPRINSSTSFKNMMVDGDQPPVGILPRTRKDQVLV